MGLRYSPSYPDGCEVWKWKRKGVLHWTVEYTPPYVIGARARPMGIIRLAAPGVFVVLNMEHPSLLSLHQAVWWLWAAAEGGLRRHPTSSEEEL